MIMEEHAEQGLSFWLHAVFCVFYDSLFDAPLSLW